MINNLRLLFSGLIPLFLLAHFGHHLLIIIPTPLLPMMRKEFSLDYTQSGLLISAFTLACGFGQLPAGWLADRIGRPLLMTIGISGVAVAGFLIGLSQTYLMLIIFLMLMGAAGGGYHPAAPPLMSALVAPEHLGRVLGLHMVGGNSSLFLAPIMAAAISSVWGWRSAFIGLSVPSIIFGIVFYVLLHRRVAPKREAQARATTSDKMMPIGGRLRRLVAFLFLNAFTQAVFRSTLVFVPLFMVDHHGVSEETAAASLGGILSDRFGRVRTMLGICLLAGPGIYILNRIPYGLWFGVALFLVGVVMVMRIPVAEAYIVGETLERHRSTMLGILNFSGTEAGGVLTPLMGYLIDRLGFYRSFSAAGASLVVVTLLCSLFLRDSQE